MAGLGAVERASLRVLIRHLGWLQTLKIGIRITRDQWRGAPFEDLPKAKTWKEQGSRDQAGSAILLYRSLLESLPPEDAFTIVADVVDAGGVAFLSQSLGALKRSHIAKMSEEERKRFAKDRSERFPNATLTWNEISPERVQFTVHKCRLLELAVEAGHPELGKTFCAGDARFFGQIEPDVSLDRPTTLAEGGPHCKFTIEWNDKDAP
jgi:hypothetical protein